MSENEPNLNLPAYTAEDFDDPIGWIERQPYGMLKNWLRQVVWKDKYLPVMIPSFNAPPMLYLIQLLLRSNVEVTTALRTIVPELLREWNAYDKRECLLNLLLLCSYLSCNEAETTIGRIITEKLGDQPEDIKCRKEALGALQSIGTERTIHLFKRYIDDPEYAAYCYRGLYLFDPTYAATELPALMKMFDNEEGKSKLKAMLHFFFNTTLKPSQYFTVIQSFVENAPGSYFLDFFELLRSFDILNESFFANLHKTETTRFLSQIIKRTPLEDSTKAVNLLKETGIELQPPPDTFNPEPFPPLDEPVIEGSNYFSYRLMSGEEDKVLVLPKEELSERRLYHFAKDYNPFEVTHLFTVQ